MSKVVALQSISSWLLCSPLPERRAFPEGTQYVPHGAFQAPRSPCHPVLGTDHTMQWSPTTPGLSLSLHPKQVTISPRACGAGQRGWPSGKATASTAPGPRRGLSWGPLKSHVGWFSLSWTPAPPTMDTSWIFPSVAIETAHPKQVVWLSWGVLTAGGFFMPHVLPEKCCCNTRTTQFSIPFVSLHVIRVSLDGEDAKDHLLSLPISSLQSIHTNFFSFYHNKDPQWQLWFIG